jgi:hypothetical protein
MKRTLLALALLTVLFAGTALAQVGGITGVVFDANGAVVEGARVSIWQDGACKGYVLTGADGIFLMEEVAVGTYSVKAAKPQVGQVMLDAVVVLEAEITDVGILTLAGGGPHGHGPKFQYQQQGQIDQE